MAFMKNLYSAISVVVITRVSQAIKLPASEADGLARSTVSTPHPVEPLNLALSSKVA